MHRQSMKLEWGIRVIKCRGFLQVYITKLDFSNNRKIVFL